MKKISIGLLLTGTVLSAQARVVAEQPDSVKHLPMTETSVKLNEVVVTGLTGSQKLNQAPAPISIVSHQPTSLMPWRDNRAYRRSPRAVGYPNP